MLRLSSYFQVLQSLYQSFGDYTEHTNYNWYHCHFVFHSFVCFRAMSKYLHLFLAFLQFLPVVNRNSKVSYTASSVFSFTITRAGCLAVISWILCISFSRTDSGLCIHQYIIVRMVKSKPLAQFTVDRLPHSIVFSLVLSLSKFIAFAYYVIDSFVSGTT